MMQFHYLTVLVWISVSVCQAQDPPPSIDLPPPTIDTAVSEVQAPSDAATGETNDTTVASLAADANLSANESSSNVSFPDIPSNDTSDIAGLATADSNTSSITNMTDIIPGNTTALDSNATDTAVDTSTDIIGNDTSQIQTALETSDVPMSIEGDTGLPPPIVPLQNAVDIGLPPPLETELPPISSGEKTGSPSPELLQNAQESATASGTQLTGKGVDVPPPPPMPPNLPSVLFSEDVGSTTVEISANMTDALNKLINLGVNDTTSDAVPLSYVPETTTPMTVPSGQDTIISEPVPGISLSTASPLDKATLPYVPPPMIFDIPTVDHPPPIFSGNRRPPMFDLTPEPPTVQYVPATIPPDAPPPPIMFPAKSAPTTIEEAIAVVQPEAPIYSPIEQMRRLHQERPVPASPRFMSVSELAELALGTARQNQPPANTGWQVFFNARQPTTTTSPLPPTSMIGSAGLATNQSQSSNDASQSIPIGAGLSQGKPGAIEKKPFYDANYLLSHLAEISGQSEVTPKPTETKTTDKPFYDAIYLLSHLSELQNPPTQPTTPSPTTTAPIIQSTENIPHFFPHELQRIQREQQLQLFQQQEQFRQQQEMKERQLQMQVQQQLLQQRQLEHQRQQQELVEQQQRQIAAQKMQENLKLQEFQRQQLQQKQQALLRSQLAQVSPTNTVPWWQSGTVSNVKPGVIEKATQERANNNAIKDQRQTFTDIRPLHTQSNSNAQTFTDTQSTGIGQSSVGNSAQNTQENLFEHIFASLRGRGDISNLVPRSYVYGEGSSITAANTQPSSTRLNAYRDKFNRKMQTPSTSVPLNEQIQTSELQSLLGVRDNIHMNYEALIGGLKYTIPTAPVQNQPPTNVPRTGSEVRRNFNQHMGTEPAEPVVSVNPLLQQIPKQTVVQVQPQIQQDTFALASKLGIQSQIKQDTFPLASKLALDTSSFNRQSPSAPRKLTFGSESLGTVSSISIFKAPALSLFDKSPVAKARSARTQTHWSVPSEQQIQTDHVSLPYKIAPSGQIQLSGLALPATPDSDLSTLQLPPTNTNQQITENNSPADASIVVMPPTNPPTLPIVTTMAATRRPWMLTTMSPTIPPTADPNPPAIFDKNVQVTFMPMPKIDPHVQQPAANSTSDVAGWESGANFDQRCRGCVFVNDRCLLPDPVHCNMYIECVRQGSLIRAFNRECAIGLFFDRSSFLCVDPSVADCPTDRCREGIKSYVIHGHCKNYWQCDKREGGRYFANRVCCPDQGGFVEGRGCVQDASCTENCNLTAAVNNNPIGCKLRKTASPTRYYDEDALVERPCAPGTLFDELKCTCVQDISIERSPSRNGGSSCNPKLKLTFDTGSVEDGSTTKQSVGVEGVSVSQTGEAIMTGAGKLILWRYANLMFPVVFAVRLRFRSTSPGPRIQTLISNCAAKGSSVPSFEISLDTMYHEVIINVDTYESAVKQFKLTYQQDNWTTVDLIYDGERIVGSVDGRSRNILAAGLIETRPSPFIIGSCNGTNGFKGLIDDVYLYEDCVPDDMYGIFISVLQ